MPQKVRNQLLAPAVGAAALLCFSPQQIQGTKCGQPPTWIIWRKAAATVPRLCSRERLAEPPAVATTVAPLACSNRS